MKCKVYSEKTGLLLSLEESSAENAAGRLAKIDLREYPESEKVIKGSVKDDDCYYTNSIHFAASADIDLIKSIVRQSKFHVLLRGAPLFKPL